jgi:NAD(P)-dependent dehydrogenase (short-subunit alcohol dehydrogenase family)
MGPSARLAGAVAIVTGGGRGIGRAVSLAMAAEGATVVVADAGVTLDGAGGDPGPAEETAREIVARGGHAVARPVDVTDEAAAASLVDETVEAHGRLDVLVNAAGILRHGTIFEQTGDDWNATLAVHLGGTFNTTRAAAEHWRRSPGRGRLLNFGSDAGLFGASDEIAYATAKAGVVAFTLSCAESLKPFGATANVFIPQAATRMTGSFPVEDLPDPERWATGEFDPDHVPPALLYLASEEGGWITGQVIAGFGFEVHLYSRPERRRSLVGPGPWELETLFRRMRPAFEAAVEGR